MIRNVAVVGIIIFVVSCSFSLVDTGYTVISKHNTKIENIVNGQ